MMRYKKYVASVEIDAEANLYHGEMIGIRDVITFPADQKHLTPWHGFSTRVRNRNQAKSPNRHAFPRGLKIRVTLNRQIKAT